MMLSFFDLNHSPQAGKILSETLSYNRAKVRKSPLGVEIEDDPPLAAVSLGIGAGTKRGIGGARGALMAAWRYLTRAS
jgi:hypothetical protein